MVSIDLDFIAAGGNRNPSAADWAPGILAFGAGNNVALWNPEDERSRGVTALLAGHTDTVNAVKIFDCSDKRFIVTGGSDNSVRLWNFPLNNAATFEQRQCLNDHQGSVNTICVLPEASIFATGSADGTVNIWHLSGAGAKLNQSIPLKPRYLPLACAFALLEGGAIALAVAGTSSSIQIYVRARSDENFELQATLSGHEGWIRSLDFVKESEKVGADVLLASASQDKYIRLWRFSRNDRENGSTSNGIPEPARKSLSNKAREVGCSAAKYAVTFEALLVGHEDWIYTARWAPQTGGDKPPMLLSASADSSLALWQAHETSGVWVCETRLGEISSQKGSTTATGSTGGFWIGLWQPDCHSVVSLGRTGSWRRWVDDAARDMWCQAVGVSGHSEPIQGIAWAADGSYLISTGSDETTRLFAEWKRDGQRSWHEFARPQIHGYDLNCIASLSVNQFVSGADEKLLRVFNKPKAIDNLLADLCGSARSLNGEMPDAANIPVLGLSNKAVTAAPDDGDANFAAEDHFGDREAVDPASVVHKSTLQLHHPPFEEHLSRHTLWPEHEKLYGHGYEISAVAASPDGSLIATACKASSIDHAVIRLYETKGWREIKPSLTAHSLTVTSLAFSDDAEYLLSVGRDRQWAVFKSARDGSNTYQPHVSNPKGHSRMILDCSWAPSSAGGAAFATAGRDKVVKLWKMQGDKVECATTITASTSVTAVAFSRHAVSGAFQLAYGAEDGSISIVEISTKDLEVRDTILARKEISPCKAVNVLRWRPNAATTDASQLAAGSDDNSLRIFKVAS